jgi:outer membrane protein assembly factor BamB
MQSSEQKLVKQAEVIEEFGPFPGTKAIHGVTFDGTFVWFALGDRLQAFEPREKRLAATLQVAADAGSAFDGRFLYQIAKGVIQKLDPATGAVLRTIPCPDPEGSAGLTWAEGKLWVAHYRSRKIHQVDPSTGKVLRTLSSTRFVTGVTFVDDELWHGTWEDDRSELRHISPESGEVLETLEMPPGTFVSGLESNGKDLFYCGGGPSGTVRVVRKPKR